MNSVTDIDYSPTEEGWAEGSNRMEPSHWGCTDYTLLHAAMNLISTCSCLLSTSAPGVRVATPPPTHTHTNSGNRKVTATINTPLCSPGSASVLQTNQVAWIGGGRNRRKKNALSMIYGARSASAPPLSSFFDISLKPPHHLRDRLTCLGQGLIVCLGKSAATCFLSRFTLIAFSYTQLKQTRPTPRYLKSTSRESQMQPGLSAATPVQSIYYIFLMCAALSFYSIK